MTDHFYKIDGRWCHGPLWKRIINPILRVVQFWSDRPYVFYSRCSHYDGDDPPRFISYGFGRVRRLRS